MLQRRHCFFFIQFIVFLFFLSFAVKAQKILIINDVRQKTVKFGNSSLQLVLEYNQKAILSSMMLYGGQVLQSDSGIYSAIRIKDKLYSSLQLQTTPTLQTTDNTVILSGIIYGKDYPVNETWTFTIGQDNIKFKIDRKLSQSIIAEQVCSPVFTFRDMNMWDGAFQDYGGLAWFYLFNHKLDTYGVHSHSSQFWNNRTDIGLDVSVTSSNKQIAMEYSRTQTDHLTFTIGTSETDIIPRFDSGTHRRRYLRDRTDVWAPVTMNKGISSETITLSSFRFNERYGRGDMKGISGEQISAVLNTIARIGVIDKNHFGGNSWHTPYGPICLHEQYIAQMGLAINDSNYLNGYKQCLNFYRDNAVTKEGRVWPRWAYSNEDAMPGKYTDKGFYEAQWGYLLDSNPDFVTNVSELYDLTGDKAWVKTQQAVCEKALDWILNRDENHNGLVEMITDSTAQKRGSDWIDIIWASYENAFVNAKLYHALVLWSDIEKQLGNKAKENHYRDASAKLKASFNKTTSQGGFWDESKNCYVHWLDKDGSVHGSNMVTPVNFMAIAYGICDDEERKKTILDNIETQMQKEKLFFWPICMYSYQPGEGNDWQFPFPNYENGDLFLSWGSVAVQAYASYKPEIAVRYVKNVLNQYAKDGLAFQRYGREKQDGLGDDILAGNSLSIVGLYKSVYGINPLYNRLYLDPHITTELSGTQLTYRYRNQKLSIGLTTDGYSISNGKFKLTAMHDFGFYGTDHSVMYFHQNSDSVSLQATLGSKKSLAITVNEFTISKILWTQSLGEGGTSQCDYKVKHLLPRKEYILSVNHKQIANLPANLKGEVSFHCTVSGLDEQVSLTLK